MNKAKEHAQLKKYGKSLGREGLAKEIIKICKEVSEENNYKNSIIAAGKIQALAIACGYEGYWKEKRDAGYYSELDKAIG